MKQWILERTRSIVEGFLHQQCADTTLSVLLVNPEVDGYGNEFLWIRFTYDDSNGTSSLLKIELSGMIPYGLPDLAAYWL